MGDEFEPLHAVYRQKCHDPIVRRLARGERRVISFFADVRLRPVPEAEWRVLDPEGRSLVNLNTPDDLGLCLLSQERMKRLPDRRLVHP
jgi:molybdopterin-guanine dinucleotide biosynthesis protein A